MRWEELGSVKNLWSLMAISQALDLCVGPYTS